jgi:hypothetical protein
MLSRLWDTRYLLLPLVATERALPLLTFRNVVLIRSSKNR